MISIATAEDTGLSADGLDMGLLQRCHEHGWLSTFFVSITGHL